MLFRPAACLITGLLLAVPGAVPLALAQDIPGQPPAPPVPENPAPTPQQPVEVPPPPAPPQVDLPAETPPAPPSPGDAPPTAAGQAPVVVTHISNVLPPPPPPQAVYPPCSATLRDQCTQREGRARPRKRR